MITEIYRIKTMNSFYEIRVLDTGNSICRKTVKTEDHKFTVGPWRGVSSHRYLDKLYIGASFRVPGVVTTSVVEDYEHLVATKEPKRRIGHTPGIAEGMAMITQHVIDVANGRKEG